MASRWTPGALSHDFGGREPSGVKCVDGVIVDRYDPPECPVGEPGPHRQDLARLSRINNATRRTS